MLAELGRTLEGHADTVWSVCVSVAAVLGELRQYDQGAERGDGRVRANAGGTHADFVRSALCFQVRKGISHRISGRGISGFPPRHALMV